MLSRSGRITYFITFNNLDKKRGSGFNDQIPFYTHSLSNGGGEGGWIINAFL